VFEEIAGLPLHPLTVHAAVVFVPLLALVAVTYALVARWQARLAWAAVALSVIAPVSTVVAVLSGDAFQQRRQLPLEGDAYAELLADHRLYGQVTMWTTLVLGAATLVLVWWKRLAGAAPTWMRVALTVVVVAAGVVALVAVVLTGDSGARHVWEQLWGFLQ
jgi:hypothetical protein